MRGSLSALRNTDGGTLSWLPASRSSRSRVGSRHHNNTIAGAGGTSEFCENTEGSGAAFTGYANALIATAASSLEMDFIGLTS